MDRKKVERWVRMLESGRYEQIKHTLRESCGMNSSYC